MFEPVEHPLWQARLEEGMELVKQKMKAGRLHEKITEVQIARPVALHPA